MECFEATQFWPISLFFIGAALTAYLIEKECQLGAKGLFLALIGLQSITRTTLINLAQAATLIVPFGTWVWLAQACFKLASNAVN